MTKKDLTVFLNLLSILFIPAFILFAYYSGKGETYWGTVAKVPEPEPRRHKSNVYYDRYLLINFDNGVIKAIEVEPTTYYNAHVGKRVCFDMSYKEMGIPNKPADIWFWIMGISFGYFMLRLAHWMGLIPMEEQLEFP